MTPLIVIAIIILALGLTAWFYRSQAIAHKAEAKRQELRATQAEASSEIRRALDTSIEQLHQKHRAETVDETQPEHLAARSDLDNDWSDRLSGEQSSASHSDGASITGAADSSSD